MLNETLHPEAEDLTRLLFRSANALEHGDDELAVYDALASWVGTYRSDEAKADLYARIIESLDVTLGETYCTSQVSKALWQNMRAYPNGG